MLFNGTDAALLETFTDNEDEARLSMIPRGGVEAWLGTIEHKIGRSLLYVYIITRYPACADLRLRYRPFNMLHKRTSCASATSLAYVKLMVTVRTR